MQKVNLVKLIYKSNTCRIKKGYKISEEFIPSKRYFQRCCISPALFKIYMDVGVKRMDKKVRKNGCSINE